MKSTSELTDFYYQELYPSLKELESVRETIAWRLKVYGFFWFFICGVILLWLGRSSGFFHPLTLILGVIAIAVAAGGFKWMTSDYAKDFKNRIIAPLIRAIEPTLNYNPALMVSRHLFERSQIFKHSIDRYSGNDYVQGHIDGIALEFSDIHAEYETRDSKGRTQWHTLFRGLFLVAEFNKHFKARTILLPDHAEKTFGSLIGGWLQSINFSRDDLIRLDHPEFEKQFVVYGNDPIEARYILSHAMMHRILEFQKKISHPLFLSFAHNHIHVAIGTEKDLFEPSIFKSLLDYKQAMEYVTTLKNTLGLVEELKLNEKLWSKI